MKRRFTQKEIDYMVSPKGILESLEDSLKELEDPLTREGFIKNWNYGWSDCLNQKSMTAEEIKEELERLVEERKSNK